MLVSPGLGSLEKGPSALPCWSELRVGAGLKGGGRVGSSQGSGGSLGPHLPVFSPGTPSCLSLCCSAQAWYVWVSGGHGRVLACACRRARGQSIQRPLLGVLATALSSSRPLPHRLSLSMALWVRQSASQQRAPFRVSLAPLWGDAVFFPRMFCVGFWMCPSWSVCFSFLLLSLVDL